MRFTRLTFVREAQCLKAPFFKTSYTPGSRLVTARNTQTNASRSTQTGDTGVYRVTNLLPGVYEVLFEKRSFQTLRFSNVNVRRVNRIRIEVSYEHGRSNQL